jgi:cytoskeletal protein CcmA (bactofilin family)
MRKLIHLSWLIILGGIIVAGVCVIFFRTSNIPRSETASGSYISAARTITIDGTIRGDAIVSGWTVRISGDIRGDLYVLASNVLIDGSVRGTVHALSGQTTIQGRVGGATIITNKLDIKHLGTIERGLIYGALASSNNGNILGSTTNLGKLLHGYPLISYLLSTTALLFIGLVIFTVFPIGTGHVRKALSVNPLNKLIAGSILLLVLPILALLLILSLIGLPLGLVFIALWLILIYVAPIYVGWWIGDLCLRRLFKSRAPNPSTALIVGIPMFMLLAWIPILGILIRLIGTIWPLGTMLYRKLISYPSLRAVTKNL